MTAGTEATGTIEVRRQDGDGTGVVIDEVVLVDEGYVALYADGGGAPGKFLGASELLDAGSHRAVDVRLEPALAGPTTGFVILHREASGNGTLDGLTTDPPVEGADGGVVVATVEVGVGGED